MFSVPVPDYFQGEDECAIRSQVDWLDRQLGLANRFFAGYLRIDEESVRCWRDEHMPLPPANQSELRDLWQTLLHLFSFLNFDELRIRQMLEHVVPSDSKTTPNSLTPPWLGGTLKDYLEKLGPRGLAEVERWVTSFRFGDPYAA